MMWVGRVALAGVLLGLVGCSRKPTATDVPEQETALHQVGEMIRLANGPGGRPPAKPSDFDRFQSDFPIGYQAVKSGAVVVVWGAGVVPEGEVAKGGGPVVAYEKDAPAQGGYVLLASGEVKTMTAAEFASAPKAK